MNKNNLVSKTITSKICVFLIIAGCFYSIINSIIITEENDIFYINSAGDKAHRIIRSDISHYWEMAYLYKKDIEKKKPILKSGGELHRNYLYPKFIATYYLLINKKIKNENNEWMLNNYKFGIPIIQSLIFYLCLIIFYNSIKGKFSNLTLVMIILFLSFEPTIFQYHSSYWTESIYLSMLLIFFSFFIQPQENVFKYFFLGLFLGLMYMQRTSTFLMFFPIIIYLFIIFKRGSIKKIILFVIGYFLILLFIGFENFNRSGSFYITTLTQSNAHYNYVAHKLNAKKLKITEAESLKLKNDKFKEFSENNNLNNERIKDLLIIADYERNYFLKALKGNIIYYTKYHIYKTIQALILGFDDVKKEYLNDKTISNYWELPGFKKNLYSKIIYSFIIYSLSLIGLIKILLNKNTKYLKISLLIILIIGYYIGVLGWVGVSRYMVPNLIFISIFFGIGSEFTFNFFKNKLIRK